MRLIPPSSSKSLLRGSGGAEHVAIKRLSVVVLTLMHPSKSLGVICVVTMVAGATLLGGSGNVTGAGVGGTVGMRGEGVGSTGGGVESTGAGVESTGAGVVSTGAGVGSTGDGVGSAGAGVGSMGAGVGSTGEEVGADVSADNTEQVQVATGSTVVPSGLKKTPVDVGTVLAVN